MADNSTGLVAPSGPFPRRGFTEDADIFGRSNFSIHHLNEKLLEGGMQIHGGTFEVAVEYIIICVTPLIVLFGIVGNAICLFIFTSTYMRFKSSSTYLAVLAMSDGVFLICVFIVWLSRVNVNFLQYNYVCKVVFYLMYLLCFSSSWIVVAFTAERYILVHHPLTKDRLCTRRVALTVSGAILCTGALGYIVAFWTYGVNRINDNPFCMPLTMYYDMVTVVTGVDMALTFLIPVVIIIVLNIRILVKLHGMKSIGDYMLPWAGDCAVERGTPRRRPCYRTSISRSGTMHVTFFSKTLDALMDDGSTLHTTPGQEYGLECLRRGFVQRRTARLVLFASTVFVLLNTPSYVVRIKAFVREVFFNDTEPSKEEIQWRKLFQICYFLNFAVDFVVYGSCSGTFRAALKRFLSRYRKKEVVACATDST